MASLRGIFQGILDKTDLDEKLVKGFKTAKSNLSGNVKALRNKDTRQDWINGGGFAVNATKSFAKFPAKFGEGVGNAITAPYSNYLQKKQNQTYDSLANTLQNRASRQLTSGNIDASRMTSQRLADLRGRQAGSQTQFGQNLKQQRKNTIAGGAGTLLQLSGAKGITPAEAVGTAGLSGGLGYGLSRVFGSNHREAMNTAGSSMGDFVTNRGLNNLTNPLISKVTGKIAPGNRMLRSSVGAVGNALANVGEDVVYNRLAEDRGITPMEAIISGGVGGAMGGLSEFRNANDYIKARDKARGETIDNMKNVLTWQKARAYKEKFDDLFPNEPLFKLKKNIDLKVAQAIESIKETYDKVGRIHSDDREFLKNIFKEHAKSPKVAYTMDAPDLLDELWKHSRKVTDQGGFIKLPDDIKTRNKATGVPDSAVKELDELMNYPKYLAQMGYSPEQIDKIGVNKAKEIIKNKIAPFEWEMDTLNKLKVKPDKSTRSRLSPEITDEEVDRVVAGELQQDLEIPKLKKWFNKTFNPIKNAPEDVQTWVGDWRKNILSSRVEANQLGQGLKTIPQEDGLKIMQYIQEPTSAKAKDLGLDVAKYQDQIENIRTAYDVLRDQGINEGLDVGYLENYLNQVWKESYDDVIKARGLGKNPSFTKDRVIPTYEEGIKLGLTPRFTHPAQLIAHYKYQLGKAVSNKQLVDQLTESGHLLPGSQAPANWKTIDAPLFPKSQVKMGNKTIIQDYKASPNIAHAINSIFEPKAEGGLMHTAANVSKKMQDLTLSGGVPKTPINSFALANAVKEITSGRVKSPVTSFFRSFSDDATKNFFRDNKQYLKMMGEEGIPSYTNIDYTQAYKNIAENKNLKEVLGDKWDEWMGDPTFKRFLPQLQVNLFKDTYDKAVKDGMRPTEARKLAGEVTKNFYGLVDNISRPQFTEDSMSALFFAPRFREGMVNFWGKNLQSLSPKNITNKEFSQNRKFLAGTVLTAVLYELLNKKLTGHWMHENKDGKGTSLEIPVAPGRSWYIPILPSIATVPRRVISAIEELSGGDIAGATKEFGGFLSQPISLGSQLLSNRTFYGGPIYQYDDPALDKLKKLGGYAFEQTSHPFVGEPMSVIQERKTPVEAAMGALELPVYPSRSTDTAHLKGRSITKFKDLAEIDPQSAYAYADKFRDDDKKSNGNIKISDGSDTITIPQDFDTLKDVYKKAAREGTGFVEEKAMIEADPTLSQAEKEQKIADLRDKTAKWAELKIKIENQQPEKVFSIKLDTYKSGGGMNVEERAKWAAGELTQAAGESDEAFNKKLDAMLESKVITKSVAEELRDTYDLPVSQYNSGGKIKSLGGSGSGGKGLDINLKPVKAPPPLQLKPFKLPRININSGVSNKPPQITPYKPRAIRIAETYKPQQQINTKIASPGKIRVKFG